MATIQDVIADLQTAIADAQAANTAPPPSSSILAPLISTAWIPQYSKTQSVLAADITGAWNGAAFDYATSTMHVVCAGGHDDSWLNEAWSIQIPSGNWTLTSPQTTFPPDQHVPGYAPTYDLAGTTPTNGNGYQADGVTPVDPYVNGCRVYHDGKPSSRHTYAGTIWLPTQKRVLVITGSTWYQGKYDLYCGWFDPATGTWQQKANLPAGYDGIASAYDHVRDRVIWSTHGSGTVYSYDPAADTHTRIGAIYTDPLSADYGTQCTFQVDGACDYVYAVRYKGWSPPASSAYANAIVRMPLGKTGLQSWQPVTMTGDTTAIYGVNPGMEYDPERNAFVFWSFNDPANVSILSLADFSITKAAIGVTVDTSKTGAGVYGRFRRYAANQYCLFASASVPVYTFTLP